MLVNELKTRQGLIDHANQSQGCYWLEYPKDNKEMLVYRNALRMLKNMDINKPYSLAELRKYASKGALANYMKILTGKGLVKVEKMKFNKSQCKYYYERLK